LYTAAQDFPAAEKNYEDAYQRIQQRDDHRGRHNAPLEAHNPRFGEALADRLRAN